MARRHTAKKHGMKFAGMVGKIAPYFAFITQLTEKDMPTITSQTTTIGQLKTVGNVLFGRVTGFNIFKDAPQFPVTRNWAGLANKWTGLGFAMMLYGHAGKSSKFLPKAGTIGSIGKKLFVGGAVGGYFDAPSMGTSSMPAQQYTQPYGYATSSLGVNPYSVPTGNLPLVRDP